MKILFSKPDSIGRGETSVKETGMTIKTKYAIGDKIDLGNYVNGEGTFEVYRMFIQVYENKPMQVIYFMPGFRQIEFLEDESGEQLKNIKLK